MREQSFPTEILIKPGTSSLKELKELTELKELKQHYKTQRIKLFSKIIK